MEFRKAKDYKFFAILQFCRFDVRLNVKVEMGWQISCMYSSISLLVHEWAQSVKYTEFANSLPLLRCTLYRCSPNHYYCHHIFLNNNYYYLRFFQLLFYKLRYCHYIFFLKFLRIIYPFSFLFYILTNNIFIIIY